jgi:uncharacterized repeat protein (TIGR04076 family)
MERRSFVASVAATAFGAQTQPSKAVRITVLKRSVQDEFRKYSFGPIPICDRFKDGQQFTVETVTDRPPEGMLCKFAWEAIRGTAASIKAYGPERTVACCTDGFRPVFFLIERQG